MDWERGFGFNPWINPTQEVNRNTGLFIDCMGRTSSGSVCGQWADTNHYNSHWEIIPDGGCSANNGTKANPCLTADILGDWREEVIWRTSDSKYLRIYTTTAVTNHRIYTLMHDPVYRLSIAWQNVAYNQPPHTGFYLGEGMSTPPRPDIYLTP